MRFLAVIFVVNMLLSFGVQASGGKRIGREVKLLKSFDQSVCGNALHILRTIPREEFPRGDWKLAFGKVNTDDRFVIDKESAERYRGYPYQIFIVDLDNDGVLDAMTLRSGSLHSVLIDHVHLLSRTQVASAVEEPGLERALQGAPELNPDNSVSFSNEPESIVPVETHPWVHQSRTFLLMKERYFARKNKPKDTIRSISYFDVAILKGPNISRFERDEHSQRLVPALVCRFEW